MSDDRKKFENAHEILDRATAVEKSLHAARTPAGSARSTPPGSWRLGGDGRVTTDMRTVIALILFGAASMAIYDKMPSADQIAAIDTKHEAARVAMQQQVDRNSASIGVMSGQVGTLLQLKVAEAGRDPVKRKAIRIAAQRAQQALPTAQAPDPLAGTDLEQ